MYKYQVLQAQNLPCCKRVPKMALSNVFSDKNNEIFEFQIFYPRYAKIIIQSKDVDIHALIGNIGGYVGLFLGI